MEMKKILIIIIAVFLLIILFQNLESVYVNILFWKFALSKLILIFVSVLIGFVIGLLIHTKKKV
ncbi:MAG: DUF1049 domain-containing protein [candidate division Zixibacteria bacterium]|nr:DUF1049 domain-containing protein [candidate division Zixibacteria bacterium]